MKRFSIRFGLVLAVLSLLVVTTAAHAEERPFKGRGSGDLNPNFSQLHGEGYVAHLGRCSLSVLLDQSLLETGEVRPQFCVFTAANGDALAAAVVDGFFDPEIGVLAATISFRPVAEGRFADATGSASLWIVFDDWTDYLGNPSFTFAVRGTIDY
jgi:hypothetical protein